MVKLISLWNQAAGSLAAVLAPLRTPQTQEPQDRQLLVALLHQAEQVRTVHQVVQLLALARSWLEVRQLLAVDLLLQARLVEIQEQALLSRSLRSTSSKPRTGRRTGKHRR